MGKIINKITSKPYILGSMLCAVGLILLISGSYAAYLNSNVAKKVVSTGEEGDILFSSNYLYAVNRSDMTYSLRRISPMEVQGKEGYTFTVQICNYAYGNVYKANSRDITYRLKAQIIMTDGSTNLPEAIKTISLNNGNTDIFFTDTGTADGGSMVLTGDTPQLHSYTFFVPKVLKDVIKIQLVAEPEGDSDYSATNNQKLAVILSMRELSTTSWSGKFIDENVTHNPEDYDAWNYEIKGNGQGQLSLIWNPQVLEVSSWFLKDMGQEGNVVDVVEGDTTKKKISFPVGGLDQPEAYQLQLYRAQKDSGVGKSWSEMNAYVTVSFEPIVNGE